MFLVTASPTILDVDRAVPKGKMMLSRGRLRAVATFFLGTFTALVIWYDPKKGIQDVLLVALALAALPRLRTAWKAWSNSAGIAFLVVLAYSVLIMPWSSRPLDSARDALKIVDVCVFGFFLPAIFVTPNSLEKAFLYTASAFSILIGWDIGRLAFSLGGRLFREAHGFEPFLLIHSNVSSLLSAASLIICLYFVVTRRKHPGRLILALMGACLHAFYVVVMASRGPQIALAAAILATMLLMVPGWRRKLALVLVAAGVLTLVLIWLNPRFSEAASLRTFAGRTTVWRHTLSLCTKRPVLGYGYGLRVFRTVYHGSNPPASPHDYWHPHQYWLYVLFAQGGVGLILHIVAWGLLAARLWRAMLKGASPVTGLVTVLLVLLHVYGLADWLSVHLHILMLWLIPAAMVATSSEWIPATCQEQQS